MSGLLVIIVLGTLILILGLRLVLQSSNAGAQSPSVTIEEFGKRARSAGHSLRRGSRNREDFFDRGHGVRLPCKCSQGSTPFYEGA